MGILDKFRLEGKLALVTGCKHGIGKAITLALAEAGADIIGVSLTLEKSGSDIEREVKDLGRSFQGYKCDFSDRKATYGFISRVKADNPPLDILFSNAGTVLRSPAVKYPDDYWNTIIEINLNSHFILSREFGKDMVARGSGKIIFTASMLTYSGGIAVPSYAASKGGIGQLTKALANEWAVHGVNVNAIAPGYIETRNTTPLQNDPVRNKTILDRLPVGRWGVPDDLKGTAVFLASAASDYLHGTIVNVDGGWMAR
jgi:2-dehydro-3-deoxy-D-gluconate 5-dehydrogenase